MRQGLNATLQGYKNANRNANRKNVRFIKYYMILKIYKYDIYVQESPEFFQINS